MSVRPAAVAGMFYPGERTQLEAEVRKYLAATEPRELDFALRILIVPHAGYVYSGPTAGIGYRLLVDSGFERVVMLGPSHYARLSGLALPDDGRLATPIGEVAVDESLAVRLLADALVTESAQAHRREHSLEVQLPFLQVVLPGIPVIPLLTGLVDPGEAAALLEPLVDDQTLLLVSSDLSHYHDAATARGLDTATKAAIERLDPAALGRESACGRTGIQIALHIASHRGYRVSTLDLRNSADTAGTPERVVGYGAFALGG